jgi:dTDP-4-dehydrorhamnose reductase
MARPRLLVTGGSGQLGWELKRTLAPLGEVLTPGRDELDLQEAGSIRRCLQVRRPQWIINPAAYTAVDAAETATAAAMAINGVAPGILAEEAHRLGARLVHYSTDYVFDGQSTIAYRETDATAPASVYGRSKLEGERRILASGAHAWIFRTSWLYGARGRNFLLTILRLARRQPRLRVVADQIGSPTWVRFVAEATTAFVAAELRRPHVPTGLYHLTAHGRTSWRDFATHIIEGGHARGLCPATPVDAITTADYPTPARRPAWSVLDCGRLEQATGLRLPDWKAGLQLCLDELAAQVPPAS